MYLQPFLISFIITIVSIALILFLCSKLDFLRQIKSAKKYYLSGCRFGGVAIIIGFLGTLFLNQELFFSQQIWGIIFASIIILIFGVIDDLKELEWKTQLLFQVVVAILVLILGVRLEFITNPFGGLIFLNSGNYIIVGFFVVIFWIILMINSMNWIDGVDGLSGGVSLIGVLAVFFISLKPEVNQPPVGIISMALVGSFLGFLIFNFYPSKILAGTSGSMFMGFALASLAIFAGTKMATALLVMAIPIINAFWVIGERIKSGKSNIKSDNRHIHCKLLELGWSPKKISLLFYSATILIALIALNTRAIGKMVAMILVAIIVMGYLIFIKRKLASS
ncbi:MAG: MraY family glycosyltransferase [bacterium]|nr:MraY family glycosyltransferase [bacterium]